LASQFIEPASASPVAPIVAAPDRAVEDAAVTKVAWMALADLTHYANHADQASLDHYAGLRDQVATVIAGRIGVAPIWLNTAWKAADVPHQMALMTAFTQLGVPYHGRMSEAGEGFDCSGLTSFAWSRAGVSLAHQSGTQIRNAAPRTADTAMAGDLVYYPGHVMLYLGVTDAIVHAPYTGRDVEVDVLSGARHRTLRYGNPLG
jgi:hypothetical protein